MKRILKDLYRAARQQIFGKRVVNFRGKGIINLIDVGSAGDFPYPWSKNVSKIQHLLQFDPRNKPNRSPYAVTMNVALWEKNCEKNFYIYKGSRGSGSSLFEQNYEYVSENFEALRSRGPENLANTWIERSQLDRVEKILCRTLDSILKELNHPFSYHFLKIDSQGAEYEILKGAEEFLQKNCIGLHLELFVLPLYKRIKLLPEVKAFLKNLDFELVKKYPAHGSFNSQHDCIFLKRGQESKAKETIQKIYNL